MLMLAVAGVTVSCEREMVNRPNENGVNKASNSEENTNATEMAKFVG